MVEDQNNKVQSDQLAGGSLDVPSGGKPVKFSTDPLKHFIVPFLGLVILASAVLNLKALPLFDSESVANGFRDKADIFTADSKVAFSELEKTLEQTNNVILSSYLASGNRIFYPLSTMLENNVAIVNSHFERGKELTLIADQKFKSNFVDQKQTALKNTKVAFTGLTFNNGYLKLMASADNLLAAVDNETTKLSLATVDNSKQLQSSVSSVKAELQTSVFKGLGEISGSLLEYQNDLTYSLAGGMRQVFAGISRSNDKLVLGIWSGFRDTTISSGQLVADLWSVGINYLAGMSDSSVLAWKNFLGIKDNMNTDLSASGTDPNTLKDQIKQELYNELKNEMSASSSLPASSGKPAGLVVFPSSGSTTLDSAQTAKIKQSFSDNVIINYDSKNQSGIIKPVFRDSVGSSYLFVLTPLGR